MKLFIEIPDRNNNIKRYIRNSYNYDDLKLYKIPNFEIEHVYNCTKEENENQDFDSCEYYALISFNCTYDSQCLTNKCIDGYCIFNRENPTEFCTYIYSHSIFSSHSYIHCGKLEDDICKTNKECASVKCLRSGYCSNPPDGPSDTDGLNDFIKFYFFVVFGIPIIIYIYFRCTIKPIKVNKNINKIK